jgi:hypothetical protein
VDVAPPETLDGVQVTLTPEITGAPGVIVIVAEADFVASLTDVAFNVTVAGLGTTDGAVYVTAVPDALDSAETTPQPPAVAHDAAQVTPFAAASLLTVAVNICVPLTATDAVVGDTATLIGSAGGAPDCPVNDPRKLNPLS